MVMDLLRCFIVLICKPAFDNTLRYRLLFMSVSLRSYGCDFAHVNLIKKIMQEESCGCHYVMLHLVQGIHLAH